MLKTRTKLAAQLQEAFVFRSNFSNNLMDYDRGTFTFTLKQTAGAGTLSIGFRKPICCIYVDFQTANTTEAGLIVEYYNGSTYVGVTSLIDETEGFTRSGFITWDRGMEGDSITEVNLESAHWYRIRSNVATLTETVIKGINIVFADDRDLKREYFEIDEFLPTGQVSHILTHVAARDEIIQYLRNSGGFTQSNTTGQLNDLTSFDLLDIGQIKLAATYLALSKIFLSVQDQTDDVHLEKSRHFRSLYNSAIKTFYLDIDQDDDGLDDESERLASSTGRLLRR